MKYRIASLHILQLLPETYSLFYNKLDLFKEYSGILLFLLFFRITIHLIDVQLL